MDPEEYDRTMRDLWSGAGKFTGVVILIIASPVILWGAVQIWRAIVKAFDAGGIRLPGADYRASAAVAALVRWDWLRWRIALLGGAATLAVGVFAAGFDLESGSWRRKRRFWCRFPNELYAGLGRWAGRRPRNAQSGPGLHELPARRRPRRPSDNAPARKTKRK
jgi:hypothetical protein